MKKLLVILSMVIAVSLVYACTLRLDHSAESKTVEVEIVCAIDGAASGEKSLIGDTAVKSVTVIAQNSSGTVLKTATLDKGTSSWTGSMSFSVTEEDTRVYFRARAYSGTEAAGSILYYGISDVLISPSTPTLKVEIPTALQQTAKWARSVSSGTDFSCFNSVAVDGSGNVYAAGLQTGTGTFTYGDQSATGTYDAQNVVLVKYNSSGQAQWAKSVSAGSNMSMFNGVAVDGSGNVYAAGYQTDNGTYTYGAGVSVAGTKDYGENTVIVKYNTSGEAQWAKTVTAGTGSSIFRSIAVDSDGYVYAAGEQWGSGSHTYGEGVSATGTSTDANVVLVKYAPSGAALWAKTVSAGSGISSFYGVSVDSSGNVFAVGCQYGTDPYTYGDKSATGTFAFNNVVLVKYNSEGTAQWARTVSAGSSYSMFNGVSVDSSGNVYAVGSQVDTGTYTYSVGVSANGTFASSNAVLVKYDSSSGAALWAKSFSVGPDQSVFNSVSVDSSGNVYAAGYQGSGTYEYGAGVSAAGTGSVVSVVIVKYDSSGTSQWARTVSAGTEYNVFNGVSVDSTGNVYAAGFQQMTDPYTYGPDVSASGAYGDLNVVLVKYAK